MLRRLLPLALLMVVAASSATTPTVRAQDNTGVHGTIYNIWTFTPLENCIVKVTPGPQTLARDGTYSLALSPGDYTITAKYYSGTTLLYEAEENITLQEGENRLLDLIMFPTFEENEFENYDNPFEEEAAVARTVW